MQAPKEEKEPKMVSRMSWESFRDHGLLWWVNRVLHLLGWAIVLVVEKDGRVSMAYPARVRFRGFGEKDEAEGFRKVSRFVEGHATELREEAGE